jgi:hypothetical protein
VACCKMNFISTHVAAPCGRNVTLSGVTSTESVSVRMSVRACVSGAKKNVHSFWLLSHDVERSFSYKLTITVWMYLVNTRCIRIWLPSIFIGYTFLFIICSYNVCRHKIILTFNNRVA